MLTRKQAQESAWKLATANKERNLLSNEWPTLDKNAESSQDEKRAARSAKNGGDLKLVTETPRGRQREPRRRDRLDDDSLRSPLGLKYPSWTDEKREKRRPRPTESSANSPPRSSSRKPLIFLSENEPVESRIGKGTRTPRLTDPHRLAMRQKQIDYGKNTLAYENYVKAVPKNQRGPDHPSTPDKTLGCSKRAFDGRLRLWRRKLHAWDPPKSEDKEEEEDEEDYDPSGSTVTGWESLEEAMMKLEDEAKGQSKNGDILEEVDLDNYSFSTDWSEL
ncbi:histone RNA hairpin-binding protein-like [Oscarella lobularis]|uniref:histone RNA hairpin-binding protein-like n=1 Tax=Oscarella lobularis TaxID=121494 RepID=UPI0033143B51